MSTASTPSSRLPSLATEQAGGNMPVRLLLSQAQAARALSISARTLWSMSQPRGPIPCVRLGGRVLYSLDALRAWIGAEQAAQQKGGGRP